MKYYRVKFDIHDNVKERDSKDILQAAKDLLCALVGDSGFESFEEYDTGVIGYVQHELADFATLDATIANFPIPNIDISYEKEDAEYQDWNKVWEEEGFAPIEIGHDCIIHDTLHPSDNHTSFPVNITIDAKMAFGTGTHETTYMIVNQLLKLSLKEKKVLDCGCGTGILSIAASKMGASQVVGYDIDEWSVDNTLHNATINNTSNIMALKGNSNVISALGKKFDLVIANINRNILLEDMSQFKKAMNDTAMLILSGFYTEDVPLLEDKAQEYGLVRVHEDIKNNWCMLMFEVKN